VVAVKWVCDELRKHAEPDEYGRVLPFAVYAQGPTGYYVTRNQTLASAENLADHLSAEGIWRDVHVSLDTCG
jgi:hypothetical protein